MTEQTIKKIDDEVLEIEKTASVKRQVTKTSLLKKQQEIEDLLKHFS